MKHRFQKSMEPSRKVAAQKQLLEQFEDALANIEFEHRSTFTSIKSMAMQLCLPYFGSDMPPSLMTVFDSLVGRDVTEETWQKAILEMQWFRDEYVAFFGELLPRKLVDEVDQKLSRMRYNEGTNASIAEDIPTYVRSLKHRATERSKFPTGISSVDDDLFGGISGLTFIAGDKGIGKTWLQIQACLSLLRSDPNAKVIFFSLDMAKERMIDRVIASMLGLRYREFIEKCSKQGWIEESLSQLDSGILDRLKVVERRGFDPPRFSAFQTSDELEEAHLDPTQLILSRLLSPFQQLDHDDRVLVIIDLFQRIPVIDSADANAADKVRLDAIAQLLDQMRRRYGSSNAAILVSSETRKSDNSSTRSDLTTDSIKGSGRISYDADIVLLCTTNEPIDESKNRLQLKIAKGRDGVRRSVHKIVFDHELGTFTPESGQRAGTPMERERDEVIDPFGD